MEVKPITPEQAKAFETNRGFPDVVLNGFNNMIKKNFRRNSATFTQDAVIDEILRLAVEAEFPLTRNQLYTNRWLDVELFYGENGWSVEYDKPAYCETYAANFTFKTK